MRYAPHNKFIERPINVVFLLLYSAISLSSALDNRDRHISNTFYRHMSLCSLTCCACYCPWLRHHHSPIRPLQRNINGMYVRTSNQLTGKYIPLNSIEWFGFGVSPRKKKWTSIKHADRLEMLNCLIWPRFNAYTSHTQHTHRLIILNSTHSSGKSSRPSLICIR